MGAPYRADDWSSSDDGSDAKLFWSSDDGGGATDDEAFDDADESLDGEAPDEGEASAKDIDRLLRAAKNATLSHTHVPVADLLANITHLTLNVSL